MSGQLVRVDQGRKWVTKLDVAGFKVGGTARAHVAPKEDVSLKKEKSVPGVLGVVGRCWELSVFMARMMAWLRQAPDEVGCIYAVEGGVDAKAKESERQAGDDQDSLHRNGNGYMQCNGVDESSAALLGERELFKVFGGAECRLKQHGQREWTWDGPQQRAPTPGSSDGQDG